MKRFVLGLAMVFGLAAETSAAVIRSGLDPDGATTNSNAAFTLWQSDVGGVFQTENFNTLVIGGGGTSATTSNGNSFAAVGSSLYLDGVTSGVVSAPNLGVSRNAASGGFTWTFDNPVTAFGFFSWDNDGGTITISFNDGAPQQFTPSGVASLFWGISGLNNPISSVTIVTTDPGGLTSWDNFVTAQAATVPEPSTFAIFGIFLAVGAGCWFYRRQRATAASVA